MKKIITLALSILCLTGCSFIKSDALKDIDVYTTTYPVNYLITYLYGDNANIYSIYPSDVNFKEYQLSEKITDLGDLSVRIKSRGLKAYQVVNGELITYVGFLHMFNNRIPCATSGTSPLPFSSFISTISTIKHSFCLSHNGTPLLNILCNIITIFNNSVKCSTKNH